MKDDLRSDKNPLACQNAAALDPRNAEAVKDENSRFDLSKIARCGAKTRRGTLCGCPAMKNGRCRLHGGLSSGPKTAAGIEHIRSARLKHGRFTKAAQEEHALVRELIREAKKQLSDLFKDSR